MNLPTPVPDDFVRVTVILSFHAKEAAGADHPVDTVTDQTRYTMSAREAPDYLREVAKAAERGRLFGFMQQEGAAGPIAAGEWIESDTIEDLLAQAKARKAAGKKPRKVHDAPPTVGLSSYRGGPPKG